MSAAAMRAVIEAVAYETAKKERAKRERQLAANAAAMARQSKMRFDSEMDGFDPIVGSQRAAWQKVPTTYMKHTPGLEWSRWRDKRVGRKTWRPQAQRGRRRRYVRKPRR